MAINRIPRHPAQISNPYLSFVNGDGTGAKDLLNAGADGSRLRNVWLSSDEAVGTVNFVTVSFRTASGGGGTLMFSNRIPVIPGAGTDGVNPPQNLLNPMYWPGIEASDLALWLASLYVQVAMATAVTATKTVRIFGEAGSMTEV